jgi:hypothetical protein
MDALLVTDDESLRRAIVGLRARNDDAIDLYIVLEEGVELDREQPRKKRRTASQRRGRISFSQL